MMYVFGGELKTTITFSVDLPQLATLLSLALSRKRKPVRSKADIIRSSIEYLTDYIKVFQKEHHFISEEDAFVYLKSQGFITDRKE